MRDLTRGLRWLRLLLLFLSLLLPLIFGASGYAHAATAAPLLCQTSIDPACMAPENVAILTEAGIISTGGTGAAATTAATGGSSAIVATETAAAAGIPGFLTGWQGVFMAGAAGLSAVIDTFARTDSSFFETDGGYELVHSETDSSTLRYIGPGVEAGSKSYCFLSNLAVGQNANFAASYSAPGAPATYGDTDSGSTTVGSASALYYCAGYRAGYGDTLIYITNGATRTMYEYWIGGATNTTAERGSFSYTAPGGAASVTGDIRISGTCRTAPDSSYPVSVTESVTIAPGEPLPVPDLVCTTGGLLDGVTIEWMPTGAPDWLALNLPTEIPDSLVSLLTLYPECFVQDCVLQLEHANGESCGKAGVFCPDWVTIETATPGTYRCTYGGHVVAIEYCSAYRAPKVGILPNITETGDPVPITAPVPTGIQTPTDVYGAPTGAPDGSTDDNPRECWPTGWGVFNPFAWVYQPIVCAASFLFEPSPTVQATMTETVTTAWAGTSIAQAPEIVAPLTSLPGFSGCDGMPVDIELDWPIDWGFHWRFGYACDGPLQPVSVLVSIVLSIAVCLGGLYLITSYLGGTIQFRGFNNSKVGGSE